MLAGSLDSIFTSCSELASPIRITGLAGSARAWTVLRYARQFKKSLLVICPDDETCLELESDILALAGLPLGGDPLKPDPEVAIFPSFDRGLYSSVSPPLRTRLARAGILGRLAQEALSPGTCRPLILLTTLDAATLRTVPPDFLQESSVRVDRGQSCGSREALIQSLIQAGYLRAETAEDPGTFSARGEIIDVYGVDPTQKHSAIRLELFDDIVERIRPYDPESQRSLGDELGFAFFGPCRELLINQKTLPHLRERLKSFADDSGIPRAIRDPLLEQVSDGLYPEFSEGWIDFAYPRQASLFSHLSPNTDLIAIDDLSCQQSFDAVRANEAKDFAELLAAPQGPTRVIPPPERLREHESADISRLFSSAKIIMSVMELSDLSELPDEESLPVDGTMPSPGPQSRYRIQLRLNSDLATPGKKVLDVIEEKLSLWQRRGFRVIACAPTQGQAERLSHLLSQRGQAIGCFEAGLNSGFRWASERLVILTEPEILGERPSRRRQTPKSSQRDSLDEWAGLQALSDLSPGDTVVHMDHGIGRYQGLVRLELSGAPADFLLLEYANKDKLYLPVYRLNLIQRHGAVDASMPLDRLGAQHFQKTKEKVKDSVRKLAVDLIRLYAERQVRHGFSFSARDASFEEFEARFPYEETPDQARAIDSVLADMQQGKIMDRLICGDVGYGKTEVAIRAAYRAVSDGKQVAVLVPTTLLAHQHEQSFSARLTGLPVTVASISRFKSSAKQKEILASVANGRTDIIIGTHRLLSKDVEFKDLGLLIVDEEHRFGVEHKERLKALKVNVPVITLTATPIPRTLHMSLSGLRDISLIRTPPVTRLPIRTFISKRDDAVIKKAIDFELSRGGQVFFLHNRVQSIHQAAGRIQELVPRAKITVAHGQMTEGALEAAVCEFYERKSNVLVCTSIIESGIDLPSANTILIDRADTFGLAQLYQIRGRVGRGDQRGYAYLLVPPESAISDDAKKRLDVIQRFVELGSGFQVASHDLEIRGGGELLGPQQSGNIQAVGFEMYLELLEEAVQELRREPQASPVKSLKDPEIKTPFPAFLSDDYVPDVHQRLSLYRKLSSCSNDHQVDHLEEELRDRFGRLPEEATSLLWLIRTKVHL
ncbi:transcription-repair coupling factor, partial [bacterium]|nr:transcription-repair coupling factor [bacterium]